MSGPGTWFTRRRLIGLGVAATAIIAAVIAFVMLRPNPDPANGCARAQSPPTTIAVSAPLDVGPADGPWLKGNYKIHLVAVLDGKVTDSTLRFDSDCARCDVFMVDPEGHRTTFHSTVFHWIGAEWQTTEGNPCPPCDATVTATPIVVVDGIAQELTYKRTDCQGVEVEAGTLTRLGD